jgi:CheY-like chemotaxis protein
MNTEVVIVVAEDDLGHATLIEKNLRRAGLSNEVVFCRDGQETLDYLFQKGDGPRRDSDRAHLLLLDIRMPGVDGIEVLRRVKQDPELSKMPVIMLTTTDDPREVEKCHLLGCNNYVTKPVEYDRFVEALRRVGLFLLLVAVPKLNGETKSG